MKCKQDPHVERVAESSELLSVVRVSMRVGRRCMRAYSHAKSPKVFTQPQLLTCLILKAYTKASYRGVIELLALMPAVYEAIGLRQLPDHSTLCKFAERKDVQAIVDRCLARLVKEVGASERIVEAAADSTGMETSAASVHFMAASGRKRRRFVKLSMVVICGLLLPAALDVDFGPSSDLKQGYRLTRKASKVFMPRTLYADSGYDSEEWHRQCWEDWGTMSHAPPVIRSRSGEVGGTYRWLMKNKWPGYGRRWDIETVNSAMKRSLGSTLRARSDTALKREAALRVLTHAIKV